MLTRNLEHQISILECSRCCW